MPKLSSPKEIGLHDPLPRSSVKLFGRANRTITVKSTTQAKSTEANLDVLETLLAISARYERAIDFETALS